MKKILSLTILSFAFNLTIAQVGVNNTNPQAQLDISASSVTSPSNEDGILIPRIDNFPATNPTATQDGMMVFATGNGTPTKGFYYWDNGTTSWVSLLGSSSNDSDWYTQYSTNAPNSISDNIFTEGNVSINDGFLTLNSPTDTSGGLYSYKTINNNTSFTYRLIQNTITSNGSTGSFLTQNAYTGNGSGSNTTITNLFNGTGTSSNTGLRNSFNNDNSTSEVGINNNFISTSSNQKIGVLNSLNSNAQNGIVYGFRNLIEGGTGTIYGTYTNITNGSGNQYGSYINLSGGTGPNYGLYSSVDNITNGYAAYLLGRTSLGETTSNRYLMPASDGTAGQVMTTDGSGNISFTTPSSGGTLDQAYDFGGAGVGRTIIADNGAVDIQDAGGLRVEGDISAASNIVHDGDTDTFLTFTTDRIRLDSGGTNYVDIENSNTEITINEDSSQIDLRVESDNQDHMLFVDGSADAIGIGENNPVNPLHVGITTPFDLSYANTGQDAIYLIGGGDNSGLNAIGSSIGFGPPSSTRGEQRKAAIASIQTSGDVDHLGLAFFVHGNDINQTDMTEGMRLTHDKNLGINNTSPDANLDVVGTMQFVDGNESVGYVLTSDATGNATWTDPNTLITTSSDWTTTGNTGTNPTTNFIGTTDAQDFSIRTDNVEKVRITTKGQIETTQLQSVWIGENAGNAVTTGSSNTAVGADAFTLNTTGNNNIAIGYNSLNANTSGDNNIGVGYQALASNTTQNNNNALGYRALTSNTVGFGNSAFGYLALESNTTADRNIAFGNQALRTQTSDGFDNVALGYFTLTNNTSGDYNVAVGSQALLANTASNYNVAVGSNALASTTVNGQNVAVGHEALTTNKAPFNTGVGYRALATNTTGQYNVGIGHSALDANIAGSGNTALGYNAASNSNNTGTTAIGYNALAVGTGTQNVSIGYQAMQNSTTENQSTVIGYQAMSNAASTGSRNTAIGRISMYSNTTGSDNTAVGGLSLYSNTTGTDNTALGLAALYDLTIGNGNTVVGEQAAENLVSGNYNVVLGHQAGENMTGSSNVFIGYSAGRNSTASNRLFIENSNSAQPLIYGNFSSDEVGINWPSATALPNTLSVNGNASKSVAGGWLANSDRRLKKDINQISGKTALEKIQNMRGVTYFWNDDKTGIERPDNLQYGFIAQEIMEVFPEKVTEDNLGYYQTAYGDYDPIFVEAIKELKNEVETLKEENIKLKEALKKQEQLEQRLEALESNLN